MTKYTEFTIEENDLYDEGERFVAEVTSHGIHLDHNWIDGGLFIPHETWDELDEFRTEFLDEIDLDPREL